MSRPRPPRHARLTPRLETLVQLAEHYARSSSLIEDQWWEKKLAEAIRSLLEENNEEGLNSALDVLHGRDSMAYDALADLIESQSESASVGTHQVQLLAIPLLAWSRFNIPAMSVSAAVLDALRDMLKAHVLADTAKLSIADYLFSPDQLPQGFCPTAEMTMMLGKAALHNQNVRIETDTLPESMKFLSDSRYLLAAVAVPTGGPLFRWQEKDSLRTQAEKTWQQHGADLFRSMLAGCAAEFLLPQGYFSACRETDRSARPFSLKACTDFLITTLEIPSCQLQAVIAPFYEEALVEYRVGFTRVGKKDVLYGLVWPLLEPGEEAGDVPGQIESLLREQGVEQIIRLEHQFPVEFCDDCGSPLYPNPDGEVVHAEMPEEEGTAPPQHLH